VQLLSAKAERVTPEKLFEGFLIEEDAEVYAMLDGASVPGLLDRLHSEPSLEVVCLFRGKPAPDMAQVAPYLVKLKLQSDFTEWVVATGWGQHWGSFLTSQQGFRKLRNHLRGLSMVYRRDGTPLYFRYYDPRVLRIFLPTCSPAQLKHMFGPVDAFLAENEAADGVGIYRLNGAELSAVQRKLV
jgi:hypothetical protein